MNLRNVIIAICSLLFFMIGADKFLGFLEPPCSLADTVPLTVWTIFGVLQLGAGILIWIPKFRRSVAGFFFVFMIVFCIVHIAHGTYDIGGAAAMAVKLGLLVWDPAFIRGKDNS